MPPKRKRAEDNTTADTKRSTRSTSKAVGDSVAASSTPTPAPKKTPATKSKTKKATGSKTAKVGTPDEKEDEEEDTPVAKKPKPKAQAKPRSSKVTVLKAGTTGIPENAVSSANKNLGDDEAGPSKTIHLPKSVPLKQANNNPSAPPPLEASLPPPTPSPLVPTAIPTPTKHDEIYSASKALALFKEYADSDDPDVIGPEGFQQLCTDAQLPLEGSLPLILAWQLDAKEMGKVTREEWVKGTKSLQISNLTRLAIVVTELENLLIFGKQPVQKPDPTKKKRGDEPYDRSAYWSYAADKPAAFGKLYHFCFALAKPPQARNIDMETAVAFWSVLLVPQYPVIGDVIQFINEKGSYKGVNKDLWNMMLEFSRTVKPTLENYEADGAWPTLIDDFVTWKKGPAVQDKTDD